MAGLLGRFYINLMNVEKSPKIKDSVKYFFILVA
jgi:hypothetical protein